MKKYSIERRVYDNKGNAYKYLLITRIYNNYRRAEQEFIRLIKTYPTWELSMGYDSGSDGGFGGIIAVYRPKINLEV